MAVDPINKYQLAEFCMLCHICVDVFCIGNYIEVYLPVDDVEEAVETKHSNVVGGQVLDDADLLKHDDLGNKGNRFEPERVGPNKLPWGSSRVTDGGKDGSRRE